MSWFHRHRDVILFATHTVHAYPVGSIHTDRDGAKWVITHHKELAPTALTTGGHAPCAEVYGEAVTLG